MATVTASECAALEVKDVTFQVISEHKSGSQFLTTTNCESATKDSMDFVQDDDEDQADSQEVPYSTLENDQGRQENISVVTPTLDDGLKVKADRSQYIPETLLHHTATQTEAVQCLRVKDVESQTVGDLGLTSEKHQTNRINEVKGTKNPPNINQTTIKPPEKIVTQPTDDQPEPDLKDNNKSQDLRKKERKTSKNHFCCCHGHNHQSIAVADNGEARDAITVFEEDSKVLLQNCRNNCRNGTKHKKTKVLKLLLQNLCLLVVILVLVILICVAVIFILHRLNTLPGVTTNEALTIIQSLPTAHNEALTIIQSQSTAQPRPSQPLFSTILCVLMSSTTLGPTNSQTLMATHNCAVRQIILDETLCQVQGHEYFNCTGLIGVGCTSSDGTECRVFQCGGRIKSGDQFECGIEQFMLSSTRQYVKHC